MGTIYAHICNIFKGTVQGNRIWIIKNEKGTLCIQAGWRWQQQALPGSLLPCIVVTLYFRVASA